MPLQPTFHMRGCNRPYLLWFSSYLTFKFWSRDYHVIMTSDNFSYGPVNSPSTWTFHMRGCNRPYLLWFSRYLTFKFWSRDHVVTWLFQKNSNSPCHTPPTGQLAVGDIFCPQLKPWENSAPQELSRNIYILYHVQNASVERQTPILKSQGRDY